jgi:hypothetical protein
MQTLQFECRLCKRQTTQAVVQITDLLPPGTEVIQCHACGSMTVALIGADK